MEQAEYYQNQIYAGEDEGKAIEDSRGRADADYIQHLIDAAVKAERKRVIDELSEVFYGCDDVRIMERAVTAFIIDNTEAV
jgi:hypothetical protein